ncbi:MAG: ArsR/SmtB family transcription factor [Mycobacterium leprae]
MGPSPEIQEFLKALASETRQKILLVFVDGQERTVGQVAAELGLGLSTASEHLTTLKRAGVVVSRREAKEVYYRPDRECIVALLTSLTEMLTHCC